MHLEEKLTHGNLCIVLKTVLELSHGLRNPLRAVLLIYQTWKVEEISFPTLLTLFKIETRAERPAWTFW